MADNEELQLSDADKAIIAGIGDFDSDLTIDDRAGAVSDDKKEIEKKKEEFKFDLGEFSGDGADKKTDTNPKIREIEEKFPKIFNEFPELRSRFFRAAEYSRIFPSLDDAREALERVKTLEAIESDVFERGTAKEFLKRVHKNDAPAFDKLVLGFLEDVRVISKETYTSAIIPVLDDLIIALHQKGDEDNDDNISNAALIINMFIHGTKSLPRGVRRREHEVDEPRKEDVNRFNAEKLQRAQRIVVSKIDEVLGANLDKLVPKMKNAFMREALVDKIKNECYKQLNDDDVHLGMINSMWKKALSANFDDDSIRNITRVALQRLAREVPRVYAKLAIGIPKEDKIDEKTNDGESKTPARLEKGKVIDWGRTNDMDALDGKYTYVGDK